MGIRFIHVAVPLGATLALSGFVLMAFADNRPAFGNGAPFVIPTRHPVTPEMLALAGSLKKTPIAPFSLQDQDGAPVTLDNFKTGKPSFLVFIKEGCPCSIEAQPIFNRLAQAFANDVQFFGVTDAIPGLAVIYRQTNEVPFPLITDPQLKLVNAFKMKASASMAVVDGNGKIVEAWAGYSQQALRQANFLLGALTETAPREFDDRDAPKELTAGCAFN